MLRFKQTLSRPGVHIPLLLLVVCVASYALLIPALSFYWDDLPVSWIASSMGAAGLARYFSTNRPVWGLLFQLTAPLLGSTPWRWQVFALFWRWVSCLLFWLVLRLAWPSRPRLGLYASLLMAVYPALPVQFIAMMFSHFFIVLSAFFGSLVCTLLALKKKGLSFWLLTLAALLLGLINLVTLEYFLPLELLRPLLIWAAMKDASSTPPPASESQPPARLAPLFKTALLAWLPYLLLLIAAGVWRALFFRFQTQNYEYVLLQNLKAAPLPALLNLARTVSRDLWAVTFGAWGQAFSLPDIASLGRLTTLAAAVLCLAVAVTVFLVLNTNNEEAPSPKLKPRALLYPLAFALVALLLAGIPFWTVDLAVNLRFPNNRGVISFVPGACLLFSVLLAFLPLPRRLRLGFLALMIGLGAAFQFQTAAVFRRDATVQNNLLWQLSWRAPRIKPNTALLINDLPLHYSTDNSLTAAVNWTYAKGDPGLNMPFVLFYPTLRQGSGLPALEKGLPIHQGYLAADFYGSTSQALALYYQPPACLRVLDPQLDPFNAVLPVPIRSAAVLSDSSTILAQAAPLRPPEAVFGREPSHGWCYYFEKADLAAQQGDWNAVVQLGDAAFKMDDSPNDPAERLPFIEGYARTANWQRAVELSRQTRAITSLMQPVLCPLWQRIAQDTPPSPQKETALQAMQSDLKCSP